MSLGSLISVPELKGVTDMCRCVMHALALL